MEKPIQGFYSKQLGSILDNMNLNVQLHTTPYISHRKLRLLMVDRNIALVHLHRHSLFKRIVIL